MQDERKLLKPGSAKQAAFGVLEKRAGCPQGMTAEEILEASVAEGIKKDWAEEGKGLKTLKNVGA